MSELKIAQLGLEFVQFLFPMTGVILEGCLVSGRLVSACLPTSPLLRCSYLPAGCNSRCFLTLLAASALPPEICWGLATSPTASPRFARAAGCICLATGSSRIPLLYLEEYQYPLVQSCLFQKMVATSDDLRTASADAERRINSHYFMCRGFRRHRRLEADPYGKET
ncbi:hypothetical protein KSP40_PGU003986 [Platanthera guangdongensis]|uniref:Uncharacterized protein n=1 Tax=Platanthera guangdongensis TaxID=2320717 RepID=A0ABR2LR51_9ASPA